MVFHFKRNGKLLFQGIKSNDFFMKSNNLELHYINNKKYAYFKGAEAFDVISNRTFPSKDE